MSDNPIIIAVVGFFCLSGAFFVMASGIETFRARDGVQRVNVLSGATGVGMPSLVLGVYINEVAVHGFEWFDLVKAIVAIVGFVVMSSIASNALGRAAYISGSPIDPGTEPNDLA